MAGMLSRVRSAVKSALYSGPGRDRWQRPEQVLESLDVRPGQRVADIGAGGGYFTFRLARAVGPTGRVYAIDPDPDMRERIGRRATANGHGNIVTRDAEQGRGALPERVSLALVVETFHHLPEDRVGYFEDLAGLLRDRGRVAVLESVPRWWLFGHATAPRSIEATLAEAGYTQVSSYDLISRQSFMVFEPVTR